MALGYVKIAGFCSSIADYDFDLTNSTSLPIQTFSRTVKPAKPAVIYQPDQQPPRSHSESFLNAPVDLFPYLEDNGVLKGEAACSA